MGTQERFLDWGKYLELLCMMVFWGLMIMRLYRTFFHLLRVFHLILDWVQIELKRIICNFFSQIRKLMRWTHSRPLLGRNSGGGTYFHVHRSITSPSCWRRELHWNLNLTLRSMSYGTLLFLIFKASHFPLDTWFK